MPVTSSINLDAAWLRQLAAGLGITGIPDSVAARLLRVADNLSKLDEINSTAYASGYRAAEDHYYGRSNLASEEITAREQQLALRQATRYMIDQAVAMGKVTKVAQGKTAATLAEEKRKKEIRTISANLLPEFTINLAEFGL